MPNKLPLGFALGRLEILDRNSLDLQILVLDRDHLDDLFHVVKVVSHVPLWSIGFMWNHTWAQATAVKCQAM